MDDHTFMLNDDIRMLGKHRLFSTERRNGYGHYRYIDILSITPWVTLNEDDTRESVLKGYQFLYCYDDGVITMTRQLPYKNLFTCWQFFKIEQRLIQQTDVVLT